MPIQSTDTESTIAFTEVNQTWTVKQGVDVSVSGYLSVGVEMGFGQCRFVNGGTVSANGMGLDINGVNFTSVLNLSTGTLTGDIGVRMHNAAAYTIQNDGLISGGSGIYADGGYGSVNNTGTIRGSGVGVSAMNADLVIDNSGTLTGVSVGVEVFSEGQQNVYINNSGVLSGGYGVGASAVMVDFDSTAGVVVTNTGTIVGLIDLDRGTGAGSITNAGSIVGDVVFANAADRYDGRGGTISGTVYGYGGNDTLIGGAGDDVLFGGQGRDRLDGGKGAGEDTFLFTDVKDSRPSGADLIAKHWGPTDQIDLQFIDANTQTGGIQHLVFGGAVTPGTGLTTGQVGYYQQGGDTFVVFDNSGDGVADFKLQIHGAAALTADSFVL